MENDKDELPTITLQEALGFVKETVDDFKAKLKKYKFDFDAVDEKGRTFLINLAENANATTDYVWILLEYFADPNIREKEWGRTALHLACKNNNKSLVLALLLFGANPEILDNDDKKPLELSTIIVKEEFDKIADSINKIKIHFIQLTRKRRKYLRYIFEYIDLGTKTVDDQKLTSFNQTINNETEEEAYNDAKLFIDNARVFKSDFDGSKPYIVFEEFIIAMAKISQNHGIKKIEEFLERFKAVVGGRRREDDALN